MTGNGDVCVDDLQSVLNPARSADLQVILQLCTSRVRPAVAMAFAETDLLHWGNEAGIPNPGRNMGAWFRQESRLPFGAGIRLARVLGVDPYVLFREFL